MHVIAHHHVGKQLKTFVLDGISETVDHDVAVNRTGKQIDPMNHLKRAILNASTNASVIIGEFLLTFKNKLLTEEKSDNKVRLALWFDNRWTYSWFLPQVKQNGRSCTVFCRWKRQSWRRRHYKWRRAQNHIDTLRIAGDGQRPLGNDVAGRYAERGGQFHRFFVFLGVGIHPFDILIKNKNQDILNYKRYENTRYPDCPSV